MSSAWRQKPQKCRTMATDAERKRRQRRRERLGLDVFNGLELSLPLLALFLEAAGELDPRDCSKAAIARALQSYLEKKCHAVPVHVTRSTSS